MDSQSPPGGSEERSPPSTRALYDPLDPNKSEIRLLRGLGSENMQPGGPLLFELTSHSLDTIPPFIALSYTWGKPSLPPWALDHGLSGAFFEAFPHLDPLEAKKDINVNGHELLITRNLWDWLLQTELTRLPWETCGPFWIDAICT
ncbi:hypothetical protein BKA65DRAFT_553577 [Rhexocercosporidium sp. MPI-PUGE-AT-0058]|nr:hypothetical protein BKA65DRAFT_553577 [Rhexocercosporidium sp. MPI-PUGE-AT-0058]